MRRSRCSNLLSEYGQCYSWNSKSRDIPIAGIQSGLFKGDPVYDLSPHMQHKRSAPESWAVGAGIGRNSVPIMSNYVSDEEDELLAQPHTRSTSTSAKIAKSCEAPKTGGSTHLSRLGSASSSEYRSSYIPPTSEWRQIRSAGLPSTSVSCRKVFDKIRDDSRSMKMNRRIYSSSDNYNSGPTNVPNNWNTEYKMAFALRERCDAKPAGMKTPLSERTNRNSPRHAQIISSTSPKNSHRPDVEPLAIKSTRENICESPQPIIGPPSAKHSSNNSDLTRVSSERNSYREDQEQAIPNGHYMKEKPSRKQSRENPRPVKIIPSTREDKVAGLMQNGSQGNQSRPDSHHTRDRRSLARQYQRRGWNTHLWWWVDGGGPVLKEESLSGYSTPRPILEEEKTSSRRTYTRGTDIEESQSDYDSSGTTITPPAQRKHSTRKDSHHRQAVATQFPLDDTPQYICEGEDLKDYQFRPMQASKRTSARSNRDGSTQRTSSSRGTYRLPEKDRFSANH